MATGSDGSDLEITGETIGSKRKSLRQTKKPKIFNEYIVDTSPLDAAGKPLLTQFQELDNLMANNKSQQQIKSKRKFLYLFFFYESNCLKFKNEFSK